eukprot:192503_1
MFNDEILKYERVDSFLIILGFTKKNKTSSWLCTLTTRTQKRLIDVAILECHRLVIAAQKQSSTLRLIQQQRIAAFVPNLQQPLGISPSQSLEESLYIISDPDSVQLFELIWGITHNNNEDHAAKNVLLLCYPLVTNQKALLQCCEARFFRDDHGRMSVMSTASTASTASGGRHTPSSTMSSHVSFPSLTSGSGLSLQHLRSNSNELNKKYDRILSSFSVQAKVV